MKKWEFGFRIFDKLSRILLLTLFFILEKIINTKVEFSICFCYMYIHVLISIFIFSNILVLKHHSYKNALTLLVAS